MKEVVRHLVDEEGRRSPVSPGIVDELLAETVKVAVFEFRENPRIARLAFTVIVTVTVTVTVTAPTPQPLGQVQDVMQFHGAVHLRM